MSKKCLIISYGEMSSFESFLSDDFFVIACDNGLKYATDTNTHVDLLIGDFDSIEDCEICITESNNIEKKLKCDLLSDAYDIKSGIVKYRDNSIPYLKFKTEKDDTDVMLAIKYAIENGFSEIVLTCALGKRFDHTFANIVACGYAIDKGVGISIISDDTKIYFIKDSEKCFDKIDGYSFSVFSITDNSFGVSILGAKYNVSNITITNTFPLGQSNEFVDEKICVSVKKGILCIILSKIL